jgi:hypothetical protein
VSHPPQQAARDRHKRLIPPTPQNPKNPASLAKHPAAENRLTSNSSPGTHTRPDHQADGIGRRTCIARGVRRRVSNSGPRSHESGDTEGANTTAVDLPPAISRRRRSSTPASNCGPLNIRTTGTLRPTGRVNPFFPELSEIDPSRFQDCIFGRSISTHQQETTTWKGNHDSAQRRVCETHRRCATASDRCVSHTLQDVFWGSPEDLPYPSSAPISS